MSAGRKKPLVESAYIMIHDVGEMGESVNSMDHNVSHSAAQDAALGVTMTLTQAEIRPLRDAGRLGETAVVYRCHRTQAGGGFGDQMRHPFAWGVLVYLDGALARIYSARGLAREWTDLARLEKWMREQGFWYWWMRNDLEPLGQGDVGSDAEDPSALPDSDPGL
jgi:hypothetical protein